MATDALRAQVAAKWQESFAKLNHEQPGISGLMTYSKAWSYAVGFLRPRDIKNPKPQFSAHNKPFTLLILNPSLASVDMSVVRCCLEDLAKAFPMVMVDVGQFLEDYQATEDVSIIKRLIFRLLEWYTAWAPEEEFGHILCTAYRLQFRTLLFSSLPPTFTSAFKALCASTLPPFDPEPSTDADAEGEGEANAETPQPKPSLHPDPDPDPELWAAFETLGLFDRFEYIIASVGYEHIGAYVLRTCTGQWERPMLEELRAWMADKMVKWMLAPYARGATSQEHARSMLSGVGARFDFHMNKTLCDLRTKEIFDIIIDFPDSTGALEDLKVRRALKDCLIRVDQRSALVQSLRKANQKRLLHPGAETKLILSQYVSTIKCLRIIDPPGVLLFKVADPIRRYLRERPDTIRSIVANLVGDDDGGDTLVDENEPIQPLQQPDVEDYSDPNWEPEPVDAGPEFRTNKPSDILSTLVSIYDSKDLFVRELQVLLAQRLLAISDDDNEKIERERRNVEILKIRFGEAALQVCEVMLKDMTDSKRIDTHVQSRQASTVHPTIISKHFWPPLESSDIVMPGQFQKLQEQYSQEFNIFKPDKKLSWLSHLGTVHLELQLEDRVVEADVSPLEAAFIELFSEKSVWSVDELIKGVGSVDQSAALNALLTWVDRGVLKEDTEGVFRLLETAEEPSAAPSTHSRPGKELACFVWNLAHFIKSIAPSASVPEPPIVSVQQQQAEQMRMYWKFIEGMLTNLGTLPLDRIQSMLKYAPGYDRTIEQLAAFMEAARREGLVTGRDGQWRLNS
ncbi:hypothetical protein H0H92_009907 [Tricholoma furcatifolium]|nr:hypothetical protein H0H92_009907 [Tricholoma furcatifolium]